MIQHFHRLVFLQVVRYIRLHPLLAVLNTAAIALGISVFLAVQISNRSASASFAAAIDIVAGRADLVVRGPVPEELFPTVRDAKGVVAATPRYETIMVLPDMPGEFLHLLGIDPFTNSTFSTFQMVDTSGGFHFERWLGDEDAVGISRRFTEKHGLGVGDTLNVLLNGQQRTLEIAQLLEPDDSATDPASLERFAAMDIGNTLQLGGPPYELTSILIQTAPDADLDVVRDNLRSLVPADVLIERPANRSSQVNKMLSSFRLNLTAMSLVSLLVGMFLIYNSISASVIRRKSEVGMLRALGAGRGMVMLLFMVEAMLYGLAGCILGIPCGILLASAMVDTVAETISSQYILLSIDQLTTSLPDIFLASAIGLLAVAFASWCPAARAARLDPVESIGRHSGSTPSRKIMHAGTTLGGIGGLILAGITGWLAVQTGPAWISFVSAFFALTGFSLMAPLCISLYAKNLSPFLKKIFRSPLPNLSILSLVRDTSRHAINIGALTAAIAMVAGVSVMIHSFRLSVDRWIDDIMKADIFVTPAENNIAGNVAFLPDSLITFASRHPGVESFDTYREWNSEVDGNPVSIAVVLGDPRKEFHFPDGNANSQKAAFFQHGDLLATESLAARLDIKSGDSVEIPTPAGMVKFRIGGIYRDYTSDQGVLLMRRDIFERHWDDPRVQSLAIYLAEGMSPSRFKDETELAFRGESALAIYSNQSLRKRVFEIFDQTFAVTQVLRTIAIVVAVLGVFLTLTTLVMERTKQTGLLRAIGGSGRQIESLFLWEAFHTGVISSLLGLCAGLVLSIILTFSVNKAFFGWSIDLAIPWLWLSTLPLWFIAASVAAATIPAHNAGKIHPGKALRYE